MRRAFDKTMRDQEFLADAARINAEIDPLTGRQVQDVVTAVLATPKPIINQISKPRWACRSTEEYDLFRKPVSAFRDQL
jgi:hypothetical protein